MTKNDNFNDAAASKEFSSAHGTAQNNDQAFQNTAEYSGVLDSSLNPSGDKKASVEPKLPWYKHTLVRKLRYALIAIIVSLTVWGYVLMNENPARLKSVDNVPLTLESGSAADLRTRGLIISDYTGSPLPNVNVKVLTTLNDLPRFANSSDDVVTAKVSLNDINEPGTYDRAVLASTKIGTVDSVEPSTVSITVERLVPQNVPVSVSFIGELPEGYRRGEPELSSTSITISGAESTISSVVRASCIIDLSDRTETINESFKVVLLDRDNNVIDSSVVVDVIPSVIVRMTILPYRELELMPLIRTVGELDDIYEVGEITIKPTYITIVAEHAVLDSLDDQVYIEPFDVSGKTAGVYTQRASLMGLPAEAVVINENSFIITVEIVEKTIERTFELTLLESDIIGERPEQFVYQYSLLSFTVTLRGPAGALNALTEASLALQLDVSALTVGVHPLEPRLLVLSDPELLSDPSVSYNISTVVCTVSLA